VTSSGLTQGLQDAHGWRELLAEVRAQVTAELIAEETTALQPGTLVAWTGGGWMGTTDSLGSVHRVGATVGGQALTLCGEIVPAPKRRVPHLTDGVTRSLGRCRYCEQINAGRAIAV
jgi:hypothetical protein